MEDITAAAIAAGMQEICFTDHVDTVPWLEYVPPQRYDWSKIAEAYARTSARFGDRITLRLGVELGEIAADVALAERYLEDAPPLDFIIASIHQFVLDGERMELTQLHRVAHRWDEIIPGYLEDLACHAAWGRCSVLGHLTLPLRYTADRYGMDVSFDRHMDGVEHVLRTAIEHGVGIECNTNRGTTPLPGRQVLTLYRQLGGEIITLGSDSHGPRPVGFGIRECQELLRQCDFRYFCTFEKLKPIFHKL